MGAAGTTKKVDPKDIFPPLTTSPALLGLLPAPSSSPCVYLVYSRKLLYLYPRTEPNQTIIAPTTLPSPLTRNALCPGLNPPWCSLIIRLHFFRCHLSLARRHKIWPPTCTPPTDPSTPLKRTRLMVDSSSVAYHDVTSRTVSKQSVYYLSPALYIPAAQRPNVNTPTWILKQKTGACGSLSLIHTYRRVRK